MTNPRIEAAARALCERQGYPSGGTELAEYGGFKEDWEAFADDAKAAIEAADAAAWRPIESAPEEETIIVCGGSVSQPTTASWSGLPGNPWWSYSQENYSEGIDAPTHWQPLPAPPVVDVGGGNG